MRYCKLIFILFMICLVPTIAAQEVCSTLVTAALETVDSGCSETARNEVCYGNNNLSATPRDDVSNFQFEQVGDIVSVADVESLQLSSLSMDDEAWGIALMKLQANLPDTLPGQNITFLLFGDVSIRDVSNQTVEVPVTATSSVNVRLRPTTDASVIQSLTNGQEVTAIGRLADSSWVQIRLDETTIGWVSAAFVAGDVHRLLPAATDEATFGAMQAFYFTTGISGADCEGAPPDGILIQSPQGAGIVELRANEVEIQLGSTLYLQAVAGDALYVYVLEGHATLSSFGTAQVVPAGTFATVPLDENGIAAGAPTFPQTYNDDALQVLPVETTLPEAVVIAPPVREASIAGAIDIANGLQPLSGRWQHTETVVEVDDINCRFGQTFPAVGTVNFNERITITFSADRSRLDLPVPETVVMYKTGENSYAGQYDFGYWNITFTSPTTYTGTWTIGNNPPCLISNIVGVYQP